MSDKKVSIIINNHNYGRYLEEAIQSALKQCYSNTEVIVVDDGSEDNSRSIIEGYSHRVISIFKECGGQASALNAGFEKSHGDVIIFLDSDDRLLPTATESAVRSMQDPGTVKVHWPLWIINKRGKRTGAVHPGGKLPAGDFREQLRQAGPTTLISSPTSGNAWSRKMLQKIGPIPEEIYPISADKFLIEWAPFLGRLAAISEPQGEYRKHGQNAQVLASAEQQLHKELTCYDNYAPLLAAHCERQGYSVNVEDWKKNSWWHKQAAAIVAINKLPARSGPIILVDDGVWGLGSVGGWKRLPFLEQDGQFAGHPADDKQAIEELDRLRLSGASYIAFPWHVSWWFEVYPDFQQHLGARYPCVVKNEWLLVFDLQTEK